MSKRPILSLSRKPDTDNNKKAEVSKIKKEKPKFDQKAFEKEARKERQKRHYSALERVKSSNLPMPLSKGTGRLLYRHLKEQEPMSSKAFGWAMRKWTQSDDYLNAVINGEHRFNLDGTIAESITDEEREHSRSILEQRKKKKG